MRTRTNYLEHPETFTEEEEKELIDFCKFELKNNPDFFVDFDRNLFDEIDNRKFELIFDEIKKMAQKEKKELEDKKKKLSKKARIVIYEHEHMSKNLSAEEIDDYFLNLNYKCICFYEKKTGKKVW